MMDYLTFGMMYGYGFSMLIFLILLIGLIIWIILKLFNNNDSSLGILKRRYARGEINKKEFDKLKKDLL